MALDNKNPMPHEPCITAPMKARERTGQVSGAALAMETWPVRSRAFMGAVMQGSWGIGFLLSSAIYGLFYNYIGWRGLLMIGIAPALLLIYIRMFVKEPEVWVENRRQQTLQNREVRAPLFSIFKPELLG